jgi:Zn-dependent protease with chaperone function
MAATDFFDRQDNARRQTARLVVLFGLAVVAIILIVYLALAAVVVHAGPKLNPARFAELPDGARTAYNHPIASQPHVPSYWQPQLLLGVVVGTLLVISLGSLYKISELSAGGEQVALMMGGRAINPQTHDLAERRLLNVVEEMALASGIPVPPVFVMDNEPGINAFAAGHQPGDAVVAVSAGCLRYLNREELQGVMGHEFSHILNGDMRLNLRLIGVVYGILVLAILGYYLMRTAGQISTDDDGAKIGLIALVAGLLLMILGYLGVFFGNLIKAAVSRQREFLADASSVQFTRNPGGIAGALKKIGGLDVGSRVRDRHAAEISHMFFGEAMTAGLFSLFATHPALEDRIRAVEPTFDGRFPPVEPLAVAEGGEEPVRTRRPASLPLPGPILAPTVMGMVAKAMIPKVGQPQTEHLEQAGQVIDRMPQPLRDAAREPFSAQAVIYSLLLSRDDEATRAKQWHLLQGQVEPPVYQETQRLAADALALPAADRLPTVDLTTAAIKRSSPQQYARFRQAVDALVRADGKLDLFEYCLSRMLFTYLDVHFGQKKPPAVRYRTTAAVAQPLTVVLSMLAHVGQSGPEDIQRAFQAGVQGRLIGATLLGRQQCDLRAFDAALAELAQSAPNVKRDIVSAVTACIAADGQVTLEENELLRAIAAVLGCPVPPSIATS